ncbi:hypothetical protein E2C01_086121 [Portunus trituberculatus]|uniref:Uncharacterized protein n=1 Tax=Portunus trituberculatus TaxID=210409 RepID=A0A5B7J8U2_PORTR|nr:hypothetical protein [Portunus trituberculatus]
MIIYSLLFLRDHVFNLTAISASRYQEQGSLTHHPPTSPRFPPIHIISHQPSHNKPRSSTLHHPTTIHKARPSPFS